MPTSRVRRRFIPGTTNSTPVSNCSEYQNDSLSTRKYGKYYLSFNANTHVKVVNTFTGQNYNGNRFVDYCNAENAASGLWMHLNYIRANLAFQLDFKENNNFEIIPFLFDLDSTVAMFTLKFWKQISYGAVNWGLLPFISDVNSLVSTVGDITGKIAKSYDKLANRQTIRKPFYHHQRVSTLEERIYDGTYCLGGNFTSFGDLPGPNNGIQILLDEIGFHPDLKTVWDVIPLSFVADYFIPVGDYLESVHPRGWFNPQFSLNGSLSTKGMLEVRSNYVTKPMHRYQVYTRERGSFKLSQKPTIYPEWKSPDAKQLFNTAYLARAFLSKK